MGFRVSRGLSAAGLAFGVASAAWADSVPDHSPVPPVLAQPIHVQIQELRAGESLVSGAWRIPDSGIVVSGTQRPPRGDLPTVVYDGPLPGPLPADAAVAPAAGTGNALDDIASQHRSVVMVGDAGDKLHLHFDSEARADLATALADGAFGGRFLAEPGAGPSLLITHTVMLTVTDVNFFRPHVVLSARLLDAQARVVWEGTCSASTGGEHRLEGEGGWVEDDAAALKASVSASLAAAIRVLLADLAHPFPRERSQLMAARMHVPYELARYDVAGYVLVQEGRFVAIAPRRADGPLPGVLLVDKGETSLSDATAVLRSERVDEDLHKLEGMSRRSIRERKLARRRAAVEAAFSASSVHSTPAPAEPDVPDSAQLPAAAPDPAPAK